MSAKTSSPDITLSGLGFVADPSGALFQPDERVLIVADLHFEKGSAFAKRGMMLPPYDSRETLARLSVLIQRIKPRTLIALGDTLHDGQGFERMPLADSETLAALRQGIDWVFVAGNHDPVPPQGLGGTVTDMFRLGNVLLQHLPSLNPLGPEIAGHLHPAAKVAGAGRSVRRKCFISDERRCILPAFGAYAGGLNVLDAAFAPLFPARDFAVHLISKERVYKVGPLSLVPD